MKKLSIYFFAFVLLITTVIFPNNAQASEAGLEKGINATVSSKLSRAMVSISVRDFNTQKIVYERSGNLGIKPASNMKLITAATALKILGEGYRFKTELYIDGKIEAGTLNGNVYLRGQGDPTLLPKDIANLSDALKRAGVKHINGQLIGDATWFDNETLMRGVVKEDEWKYFAPQISALTLSPDTDYDIANLIVKATPGSSGKVAKITLTPRTNHVAIVNRTKTVAKGSRNTVSIKREYGTNRIIITGNMPVGSSRTEYVTVDNPAMYTLDVMTLTMKARGITFSKAFGMKLGTVSKGSTKITTKQSAPLKDIVKINLKRSNNGMSETFTKAVGQAVSGEGSWDAGIDAIYSYAASKGLITDRWKITDTSGLSHANRITANEQTKLLWSIHKEPFYNTFLAGLPVAGNPIKSISTTLQKRLTGTLTRNKVHAKTGAITGVYSLSGYVQAKSGRWYIFSVLTQNTSSSAISAIDQMVTTMAREL